MEPTDLSEIESPDPNEKDGSSRKADFYVLDYEVEHLPGHWTQGDQIVTESRVVNTPADVDAVAEKLDGISNVKNLRVTALYRGSVTRPYPMPAVSGAYAMAALAEVVARTIAGTGEVPAHVAEDLQARVMEKLRRLYGEEALLLLARAKPPAEVL